jgi:hypothetical protein
MGEGQGEGEILPPHLEFLSHIGERKMEEGKQSKVSEYQKCC